MRRLLPKVLDVVRKYESNNPETILTEMNVKVHAHNIEFLPDAFYVRLGVVRSISVNVRLTDEARNIVLAQNSVTLFCGTTYPPSCTLIV